MSKCYILLFIALQAYFAVGCEFVDYCACTKNVDKYKSDYSKLFKQYYTDSDPTKNRAVGDISKRLEGVPASCNMNTDPNSYVADLMALCGGNKLNPTYSPFWEDKQNEKKNAAEICSFIVVKLPSLCAQRKKMKQIITKCDFMGRFDKSIGSQIAGCKKGC